MQFKNIKTKKLYHIDKYMPKWASDTAIEAQKNINQYILSRHLEKHLSKPNIKHNITKERLFEILCELKKNPIRPFEVEIKYNFF